MAPQDSISPEQLAILAGEDHGQLTMNIIIAFTVISFVSVWFRLFTRLKYQAVGWEDHSIILAMIFSIATGVFQILQVKAGNGKHAIFVPFPDKVELVLKYLYWSIITYNLSLTSIKVSIILQYKRIFTVREMRLPLYVALGICVAWGFTTFFTSTLSCIPVYAYWRILEKATARCIKDDTLWFTNSAINIFTDLMVAILPVKAIWSLQIPKRQKVALVGILTIGWFVCVVSILRLNALIILSEHPDDQSFYSAATAYWSNIEINLGIVCASLPALKPLVVKVIPGFSTRHSSRGYGTGHSNRKNRNYGIGSKVTHGPHNDDDALAVKTTKANAFASRCDQDDLGRQIYVTQQVEQRYEKSGQSSDTESQKDLVSNA